MKWTSQIVFILAAAAIIHVLTIPSVTSRRLPRTRSTGDDVRSEVTQNYWHHRERRSSKMKTSSPRHNNHSSCGHGNDTHHSLAIYPMCDWCYSVNDNPNRTPERIYEARCCPRNSNRFGNQATQTLPPALRIANCETIYYNVLVHMKSRHIDHTRQIQETVKTAWYRAAVGCTPAYPPVHDNRPSIS